jgi:hypothetical protein
MLYNIWIIENFILYLHKSLKHQNYGKDCI